MTVRCPNCGVESAPGERFCGQCGQTLPDPTATQPLPASGPPTQAAYVSPTPPPAYPAAGSAPPPYVPPPAPGAPAGVPGAATTQRDPQTAMLIEVVAGLFGFLGVGHLFAGRTNTGLALLLGWWVFLAIEFTLFAFLIGCLLLPLNVIVPIVSGMWMRNELQGQPTRIMGFSLGSIK